MRMIMWMVLVVWTLVPASAGTYGQKVLAAVLLAEARGEGETGMLAVAEVIRERADRRGVTPLAVLKPGAFTSLNGKTHERLLRKHQRHPLFDTALSIARMTYNEPEKLRNITRDATHFTHKRETPHWARGEVPVAVIGNHAFYRLER